MSDVFFRSARLTACPPSSPSLQIQPWFSSINGYKLCNVFTGHFGTIQTGKGTKGRREGEGEGEKRGGEGRKEKGIRGTGWGKGKGGKGM